MTSKSFIRVLSALFLLAIASVFILEASGVAPAAYNLIQDDGVSLTRRSTLNFAGAGVSCAEDSGKTTCTITGGGSVGYDTIQNEGVSLTQRVILNFIGSGINCVDNAGTSSTDCTVTNSPADTVLTPVAFASLPAASTAGRLQYFTDAPFFARDTGAAWAYWCKDLMVCTPAALTSFPTVVNAASSTLTSTGGTHYAVGTAAAVTNATLWVKAIPADPYVVTFRLLSNPISINFGSCGIALRESGTGEFVVLSVEFNTGLQQFNAPKFNSATSYNSTYGALNIQMPYSNGIWGRITDNSTNRIFEVSMDGTHWITLTTQSRTDFVTPDQIGIYADPAASSQIPRCVLESYNES